MKYPPRTQAWIDQLGARAEATTTLEELRALMQGTVDLLRAERAGDQARSEQLLDWLEAGEWKA